MKNFSRREFVAVVLKGGFLAFLGAAFYPILRYLLPPPGTEASVTSVVAARVGELTPDTGKIFRFGDKPGLLVMTDSGTYKAFSAVCTHLNCTVQYSSGSKGIFCACHNGRYDLNGQVISGPPPKPLQEFKVTQKGDDIIVSREG
jgi:Rieske Fe-S protein